MELNLADCLDEVAAFRGDAEALLQGERSLSWEQVERRSRNLATWMIETGASHQGKVAIYTYNHNAYMEAMYAAFKASLVPFNVNYRYREEELRYLLDNADAEIAVVHEDFVELLDSVRGDLPKLRAVLVVSEQAGTTAGSGEDFQRVAEQDRPAPDVTRSGDDLMFVYTGGTTGMPKGVMWRQADLYRRLGGGGMSPPAEDMDAFRTELRAAPMRYRTVIGPPLMHGTGWFTAIIAWLTGGAVILPAAARKFDPAELLSTAERSQATAMTIVGDSFAKPMLREVEKGERRYDLSSMVMIASSGVIWSEGVKQGLLKHYPNLMLADSFSSSEAVGMGLSITTKDGESSTGKFQLGEETRLFGEDLRPIETKPGAKGIVGVNGPQPIGYYKDPEKSARTFVELDGRRFSVPGDWAVVNDDGVTLSLLGRGSVCINTGGEKVFPEEVEEVIKRFEGVNDVVVVGVPDEKWGEAVTAVLSATSGGIDTEALLAFVRRHLAAYKSPKHIIVVDEVYRSPSGKADFERTRRIARERVAAPGA